MRNCLGESDGNLPSRRRFTGQVEHQESHIFVVVLVTSKNVMHPGGSSRKLAGTVTGYPGDTVDGS